jgi:intein/homing endonuclease
LRQGGALTSGNGLSRGQLLRLESCFKKVGSCFTVETLLLTPTGSKPIEEFRVGDLVLARDEWWPEGPVEAKVVEAVFVRTGRILHLHVGGRVIRTTGEHPFYAQAKGWVAAAELVKGDRLSSHDGQWVAVEEVFDTNEYETVYNVRIADFHTYFIGTEEWTFSVWAHNANVCQVSTSESSGEVTVKVLNPFRRGSRKSREFIAYMRRWNKELKEEGSLTRVKLSGKDRARANAWAKRERRKYPKKYKRKSVAHPPDAAAGGAVEPSIGNGMALSHEVNNWFSHVTQAIPVNTT